MPQTYYFRGSGLGGGSSARFGSNVPSGLGARQDIRNRLLRETLVRGRGLELQRGFGYPPRLGVSMARVEQAAREQYDRPNPFLNVIFDIFGFFETLAARTVRGGREFLQDEEGPVIPPWMYIAALGKGFSEAVPAAFTGKDYTFNDFIEETQNPDSFLYRHRKWIGPGLAFTFDPLTYVTLGTLSAAKIAGYRALEYSFRRTGEQVARGAAEGAIKFSSGRSIDLAKNRHLTTDQLIDIVHREEGRPFTVTDAINAIRERDITRGGVEALKVRGRTVIPEIARGRYRQIFPREWGGVRFAGATVPGTVGLGQRISGGVKGLVSGAFTKPVDELGLVETAVRTTGLAVVPDAAVKSIMDDAVRAILMSDVQRFRGEAEFIAEESASKAARSFEEFAVGMGADVLDPRRRAAVLVRSVDELTADQKALRDRIELRFRSEKGVAKKAGMSDDQVDNLAKLWERLKNVHDDPVDAIGDFLFRSQTRRFRHKFVGEILQNPLYALRISERAADALPGTRGPSVLGIYEDAIEDGWEVMRHMGERYAVRSPVKNAIEDVSNDAILDWEMTKILRAANWVQNKWKIYATTPNPAFHVMNFFGAVWNNMVGYGMYNPLDYGVSAGTLMAARVERLAQEGERRLFGLGPVAKSTERTREGLVVVREAERRGGLGRAGFTSVELGRGFTSAGEQVRMPLSWQRILGPRADISQKRLLARRSRQAVGVASMGATAYEQVTGENVPGLSPASIAVLAPEVAKVGRSIAGAVEDVVRLAPFMKASKDRSMIQLLEAYGPIRVPGLKHPGMTKSQQALMYDYGADLARRFQFDYTNLTPFERRFAKTIFPFYTYYKNNFLLQLTELGKRPRFLIGVQSLENYISENGQDLGGMQEILPEYFDKLNAFQIPLPNFIRDKVGIQRGLPVFLNPKLPFVSLNLFPPLWELANDRSGTPFWQRAMEVLTPITGSVGPFAAVPVPGAKLMFEAMVGWDLGLARPIDFQRAQSANYRQSYIPAPGWARYLPKAISNAFGIFQSPKTGQPLMTATLSHVLDTIASPFISNLGKSIPVGGEGYEGQKAKADLISFLTGIRLMPLDPLKLNRQWAYRLEHMLESRKLELQERGKDLEAEDAMILDQVRRSIDVIEGAWDLRERELYGP